MNKEQLERLIQAALEEALVYEQEEHLVSILDCDEFSDFGELSPSTLRRNLSLQVGTYQRSYIKKLKKTLGNDSISSADIMGFDNVRLHRGRLESDMFSANAVLSNAYVYDSASALAFDQFELLVPDKMDREIMQRMFVHITSWTFDHPNEPVEFTHSCVNLAQLADAMMQRKPDDLMEALIVREEM